MYCKKCGKKFYIIRNFVNLLSCKKEYICDKCYKEYPIKLKLNKIILYNYDCYILSMFEYKSNIDYNFYIKEYNQIVKQYINNSNFEFLFLDHIYISDFNLEILNMISKMFKKNLFIFSFTLKN